MSATKKNFKVEAPLAGRRLDVFLSGLVREVSREKIKRAIAAGQATIDGEKISDPAFKLKEGQAVGLDIDTAPYRLKPTALKLDKVYEDNDFLVINKPAGLVVHPGAGVWAGTLAHALLAEYPQIAEVGENLRPGIVHRLDKDTSGLMLIAKNRAAFEYAKNIFKTRQVSKEYEALLVGQLLPKTGVIEKPLALVPQRRRVEVSADGRPAKTEYEVKAYYQEPESAEHGLGIDPERSRRVSAAGTESVDPGLGIDFYTLVRVILHTGRTHQIRVHFSSLGHPVAGDNTYGQGRSIPKGLRRQFLHAKRLAFALPNGANLNLEAELPEDLQKVLDNLKQI